MHGTADATPQFLGFHSLRGKPLPISFRPAHVFLLAPSLPRTLLLLSPHLSRCFYLGAAKK